MATSRGTGFWTYRRGVGGPPSPPTPPFTFTAPSVMPFGEAVVRVADKSGRLIGQLFGSLEAVSWQVDGYGTAALLLPPSTLVDMPQLVEVGNRVRIDFTNGLQPWGGLLDVPQEVADGLLRVQMYEPGYLLDWRLTPRLLEFGGEKSTMQAAAELFWATDNSIGVAMLGDRGDMVTASFTFTRAMDALMELRQLDTDFHFMIGMDGRSERNVGFQATLFRGAARDDTARAILRQGANLAQARVIDQGPLVNRVVVATGDADLSGKETGRGSLTAGGVGELNPGETGEIFAAMNAPSANRYGLRERLIVLSDVNGDDEPGRAATYASAYLTRYGRPTRRMAGTSLNLPPGRWADFRLGSRVTVDMTAGMVQPSVARQALVIMGMSYEPAAGTLGLVFAEPPEVE